ncbi:hypothetical protein NXT08_17080 [Rhodococcus pyridinivorans]|nr:MULTISPECIES: hypothetical protein [Rhodococcus]MCD2141400.1 hypothetical protein [Rhodococcus pyridinivorans]UVT23994.1 hypothetical protein NXT08_17080 [Rhodococcus pyridinivorans]
MRSAHEILDHSFVHETGRCEAEPCVAHHGVDRQRFVKALPGDGEVRALSPSLDEIAQGHHAVVESLLRTPLVEH